MDVAYQVIYGGETKDAELSGPVSKMLRQGPRGKNADHPVAALAETAAQVATKALLDVMNSGQPLDQQ